MDGIKYSRQFAEMERLVSDYFHCHLAPVMSKTQTFLTKKQGEEMREYSTSLGGILSAMASAAQPMGDPYQVLKVTGEWNSKTTEDYIGMCKAEITGSKEIQQDLAYMAGQWRDTVVREIGRERYDELSEQLGGDLAYAYMDYRVEELMIDRLVKERMPKSSADYIIRKAAESSLLGLSQTLNRSPLAEEIEARGEAAYLPALESVVGTASFSDMSSIGSLAMTELHSVGGLTIKNCKEISIVELPGLISCGETSVDANKVNKLNIASLKDVLGDMTLSNLLIEELDLSQINFNGNTLTLQCARLNKIVGPETFNGSLLLLPKSCRLTEFTLEGISNIQGDFQCKDYSYVKEFVMPFIRVAGDMTIALNSGSVNTAAEIEFPKLQEIGGTLTLGSNSNANNIAFPSLKKILGSCSVTTTDLKNDIEFTNLESIGTDGADEQIKFEIEATNILCPKLKTINGKFDIATSSFMFGMEVDKVSYPNVESISENLSITCPYSDFGSNGILSIDFSGLKSVKGISISGQGDVTDFSSFKYLFENNVLTGESQWSVRECAYNPTYQDMKNGKYKQ